MRGAWQLVQVVCKLLVSMHVTNTNPRRGSMGASTPHDPFYVTGAISTCSGGGPGKRTQLITLKTQSVYAFV